MTGGSRHGRRDNGLVATAYAVVADVDPRVGEHLLDVLGLRGIAAYLQPSVDLNPITRNTTLPARPTDRLYVDREHVDLARGFLVQLGMAGSGDPAPAPGPVRAEATSEGARPRFRPGTGDLALDAAFADIVAGFDATAQPTGTWPEAENLSPPGENGTENATGAAEPGRPPRGPAPQDTTGLTRWRASTVSPQDSILTGLDTFGADLADDEEEDFTPPPPPPLPHLAPVTIVSILAIALGFVLFFRPELLGGGNTVMVIGCGLVIAGALGLIWRLRPGGEEDESDPDDGAVV